LKLNIINEHNNIVYINTSLIYTFIIELYTSVNQVVVAQM